MQNNSYTATIPVMTKDGIVMRTLNPATECAICTFELRKCSLVQELCCGHFFHSDCIVPLLKDEERAAYGCPLCSLAICLHTRVCRKQEHDRCNPYSLHQRIEDPEMSESIQQLHQHKPTPEDKIICAHILEALSPEQSAMIVRRMLERGFFDRVAERIRQEAHILEQSNPTGAVTSSDIERAIFATFVKEGLQNQSKPISYG